MSKQVDSISATQIAAQGLKSQRTRMDVIANNIANALTTRTPDGGAFRRELVVLRGEQIGRHPDPRDFGVRVSRVIKDSSPLRVVFNQGHPDADAGGYVRYPNVDLSVEMVDLVSAQRAYEANVAVIVSAKRMKQKALDIIQA